ARLGRAGGAVGRLRAAGGARARALARAAPPARLASLKPLARDGRAAPHCRAVPELPEVEIASRQLRAWAKGRRVVAARAERSRVIRGQSPQRFAQLAGHRLEEVERSGKWMLLRFDGGEGLLSHLGMTGKWIRRSRDAAPPSHVRATLELEDGHVLDYRDPRLFGRLIRGSVEQLRKLPALAALGPDPLPGVDTARLYEALRKTRRSLKEALMDQRTLAGLGNIQVSEALHRARLHPQRLGVSLS